MEVLHPCRTMGKPRSRTGLILAEAGVDGVSESPSWRRQAPLNVAMRPKSIGFLAFRVGKTLIGPAWASSRLESDAYGRLDTKQECSRSRWLHRSHPRPPD